MGQLLLWTVLWVTLAPERARFLFELEQGPVGAVELTYARGSGRFDYRSVQLFTRGADHHRREEAASMQVDVQGALASGARPEALWLWRRPAFGCVRGVDELTHRQGQLCVERTQGLVVEGSALGERFRATYDSEDRLWSLRLGSARFTRIPQAQALAPAPDLFSEGFAVEPGQGALALLPPQPRAAPVALAGSPWSVEAARALAAEVHASFSQARPSSADLTPEAEQGAEVGSCLAHARRFVRLAQARGRAARVVEGLVVEGGRAYPHAWVWALTEQGPLSLDPTSLAEVTPSSHLALEPPGPAYLSLLSGVARLTRKERR